MVPIFIFFYAPDIYSRREKKVLTVLIDHTWILKDFLFISFPLRLFKGSIMKTDLYQQAWKPWNMKLFWKEGEIRGDSLHHGVTEQEDPTLALSQPSPGHSAQLCCTCRADFHTHCTTKASQNSWTPVLRQRKVGISLPAEKHTGGNCLPKSHPQFGLQPLAMSRSWASWT